MKYILKNILKGLILIFSMFLFVGVVLLVIAKWPVLVLVCLFLAFAYMLGESLW